MKYKKRKIAFLDRDGTINKDYPDEDWKGRTTPEILLNSIEGMNKFIAKGFDIIIVTNQYIINDGLISIDEYNLFTANLISMLKEHDIEILDIFYCPHTENEQCNCKKPKPGMILQALTKYDIDLEKSFMCGDSINDELLAQHFGMRFFMIGKEPINKNYKKVKDLLEVNKLLK